MSDPTPPKEPSKAPTSVSSRRKSKLEELEDPTWNTTGKQIKFVISQTWRFFFGIIVLLVSCLVFLWKPPDKEFWKAPYGVYITIVMAAFWISECLPLAITSLIPVVLVPLFGIADSDEICSAYFSQLIIFLLGGCVVALAFEYSNLHTRISLFVMKSIGAQPGILLLGMMGTCMILSCWMNNTSTTAMMVPVIYSIMEQYKKKYIPEYTAEELAEKYGIPGAGEMVSLSVRQSTATIAKAPENPPTDLKNPAPASVNAEQVEAPLPVEIASKATVNFDEAVAYWEDIIEKKKKYIRNIEVMLLVGVAASSNIGGTGVITGTGTNLIATQKLAFVKGEVLSGKNSVKNKDACLNEKKAYFELDFTLWIILCFLPMLLNTFLCWCYLAIYFQGPPRIFKTFWKTVVLRRPQTMQELIELEEQKAASSSIRSAIRARYQRLGKTTLHEWIVIVLFICLVLLWVFKNPYFLRPESVKYDRSTDPTDNATLKIVHPQCLKKDSILTIPSTWGWARFFGDKCDQKFIHDYVSTWLIVFFLLILPKDVKYYKNMYNRLDDGLRDPVLPLEFTAQNVPWGPIFMLGGGFALANTISQSGLGKFLEESMRNSKILKQMSINQILILLMVLVSFMTTLASNTATAVIVAPVLIALAQTKHVPPLYLLVTPIVGASYSFMLPISTPPNAIVYDKGNMKQMDMFIPGIFMTILCNVVMYLFTIFYIYYVLDVKGYDGACDSVEIVKVSPAASSGRMWENDYM